MSKLVPQSHASFRPPYAKTGFSFMSLSWFNLFSCVRVKTGFLMSHDAKTGFLMKTVHRELKIKICGIQTMSVSLVAVHRGQMFKPMEYVELPIIFFSRK